MTRSIALCLAVLAMACGTVTDPNDQAGSGDEDTHPTARSAPQEGSWSYTTVAPVSSSCSDVVEQSSFPGFSIDTVVGTTFNYSPDDDVTTFSCTYANNAFSCPPRPTTQDVGVNTLTITTIATGDIASSSLLTGKLVGSATCTGPGCDALAMPCSFELSFRAEAD